MFGITKLSIIFESAISSLITKTRLAPEYKCHKTMYDLVMYLLKMSNEFPDGFTMSLPNGHLLRVDWMWGFDIEEIPQGIRIKDAFGMKLTGEFGETIITVYVKKG